MNVMVSTVVAEEDMEDVPRKPHATVIIDGLDGCKGEEEYGCPWSHAGDEERERTTDGVQNESLEWMVVKSSKGIRDNKCVMLRVDVLIQKFVDVHVSVNEVLPCVHHEHCNDKLQHNYQNMRLPPHVPTFITKDLQFQDVSIL
jgi:hypothetical protein